jgi:hypothetical protein
MTIKTSGTISLLELQNEFGGSNPISISEYYSGTALVNSNVRSENNNMVASGAISLATFYGSAKNAWVVSWGDLETSGYSTSSVAVDASRNCYSVGTDFSISPIGVLLSKFDSVGNTVWLRRITTSGYDLNGKDVALDLVNGWIYSVGTINFNGNDIALYKTDSSTAATAIAWIYGNVNFQSRPTITVGNANIFMSCISGIITTAGVVTTKFNSSGTVLAQPGIFSTTSNHFYITDIGCHYDTLNNVVYVAAYQSVTGLILAKYNESLTLLWTIQMNQALVDIQQSKPATDSSGNVYLLAGTNGPYPVPGSYPSRYGTALIKLNSSGTVLWARSLSDPTNASSSVQGRSVVVDSFDNVIVGALWNNSLNQQHGLYVKYSSSGVIQWMRTFLHYTGYLGGMARMAIDSKNDLLMTEDRRGRVIKVPTSNAPFPGGIYASQIFPGGATGVVQDATHTVNTFTPSSITTATSSAVTAALGFTPVTGPSVIKADIFGP